MHFSSEGIRSNEAKPCKTLVVSPGQTAGKHGDGIVSLV